jgi:ligand-binding sensor domain-containing protein/serine phosphatase RsbU (regulator of sigma subunit)/PAS domain-containing protein
MRKGYVLLFLTCIQLLRGQLEIRNFFSVTGRKDVAVNSVIQESKGYLWLATAEGVYRFDGRTSELMWPALPQLRQEITAITFDRSGILWAGTAGGKLYSIDERGRIDSLDTGKDGNTSRITSVCVLGSVVAASTYGNGVFLRSGSRFLHLSIKNGLSDDVVYRVTAYLGSLWCATDGGISRVFITGGRPRVSIISNKMGLPDNIVRDVQPAGDRMLVAMQDSGLCYYNPASMTVERIPFFTNWSMGAVLSAKAVAGNKLVVTTEKKGLLTIDRGNIRIYDYMESGITSVTGSALDNTGQLWLSSRKGITLFAEKRHKLLNARNGLPDEKILALAIDHDHAAWAAGETGVSRLTTDPTGKIDIKPVQELSGLAITCAASSPRGDIWFGTYGDGISVVNSGTSKTSRVNSKNAGLSNDNISGIYFANDSVIYVSTLGGGLNRLRLSPPGSNVIATVDRRFGEADNLHSDYIYSAITGNDGAVYAGTDGGGLRKLENGKFVDLTAKHGFHSTVIYSLCRDSAGNIWAVSNADGILMWDGRNMKSISRKNGLRDEQPPQIIASKEAVFSIHSRGIDRISGNGSHISYYDVYEGELEPNLNAVVLGSNRLISGTNHGLLLFRSNVEWADSVKPSAFIRSLLIDYKPVALDSIHEFDHSQNNIAFVFDGVWLKDPAKLMFRYKLKGLETEWNLSREGKQVSYNNLGPGSYTFVVQSVNEEEVWSSEAEYALVVLPPIWQRWWFWAIVITVTIAAVSLFIRFRLQSLQRENVLLEKRVKERTAEIERQSKLIEIKNQELEQLSLVASKTDNAVLILDPEGHFEYVNESFRKQYDLASNGKTIYELSNHPGIRELVYDAVTNRKSVNYESKNPHATTPTWQSSTLTPIFDDNGALKKIIIIDTDVTERKRQEQVIVQKNKDITDSISYARKIQHAILPDLRSIRRHLPDSFILYITKDIVSGDFYWYTHFSGHSIIAAVDCTGHGVPGAFMSMIGYNLLNRIVNEKRVDEPSAILRELNKGVVTALKKDESDTKDGMDIALCRIDHKRKVVHYAGAMRPLWILSDGELREIRADKIPIGTRDSDRKQEIAYTTHEIVAKEGDQFYIFTDGFADQFGGDRGKKFSTARLRELISKPTPDIRSQEERLREQHLAWKGDSEQVDDILVIGFSV